MINIDTRILKQLNENEFWLLIHLAEFLNRDNRVWPSNKTLCENTGWHIEKLQNVKTSLINKKIISVKVRFNTSNTYTFHTKFIGKFNSIDGLELEESTGKSSIQSTGKSDRQSTGKSDREVLVREVLVKELPYESKDSCSNTLFPNIGKAKPSKEKEKKERGREKSDLGDVKTEVDSCYAQFVHIWTEAYPELGFDGLSGKKIKSLITQSRAIVEQRGSDPSDDQKATGIFMYLINYVKRSGHWLNGKTISTFDSKYREIYWEKEHGKQKPAGKQSAKDYVSQLINQSQH